MDLCRANVRVGGIVQGVGFRPFIHKQILTYGLRGWIRNTSQGAEMELEGPEEKIDSFTADLWTKSPKLAVVEWVQTEKYSDLKHYPDFQIIPSQTLTERNTLISPDICICDDCLAELRDPNNRRYRYPFLNCTNCGPRFTIIRDVPYDRCKTTMEPFPMCPDCAGEYADITDRRYHAQPDCCPACGPKLQFLDGAGEEAPGDPIALSQALLRRGEILAVKGLGGFHLACRCEDPAIAAKLRQRKRRDEKPFALMCRDVEAARKYCEVTPEEEAILTGFRRPIVLLRKRKDVELAHISENGYVGIMLPYTPVHYLLLEGDLDSLIMTSANLSDLPIVYKNGEALEALAGIADGFLMNNREIHVRCDDSLMWVVDGKEYPVRRSRGYVPYPVTVPETTRHILACGAEQKATFSLSKGRYVFPSQHIGDLKNDQSLENYETQIAHFERLFDMKPQLLVCDLHPDYLSTSYAMERAQREGLPLVQVQHHFAHMASCMADNGLEGPCIGVVWDGTGYGTDGTVWGGEFLTGDYTGFSRRGHIRPMALPGGDRATKELWRIAISLMLDAGEQVGDWFPENQVNQVSAMLRGNLNCPRASSMGRLFDGAAAIMGIRPRASYEGQGAILLEAAARQDCRECYPLAWEQEGGLVFDYRPMIRAICADRRAGVELPTMAAKFLNTLVEMAAEACGAIRRETGLDRVVLSGGTFQDMYLLFRLRQKLQEAGFGVFHHCRVSTCDEGISLGQTMIAERGGGQYVLSSTAADR